MWLIPAHVPINEIRDVVMRTRPVGLGIMGYADLLLKLGIRYGTQESLDLAEKVMGFVRKEAWQMSNDIGFEKGTFKEYEENKELYDPFFASLGLQGPYTPRNYEVTTIAPTGTISLVAETSSGIEPNFSWAYVREDTLGKRVYVHPVAAEALNIPLDITDDDSIENAAREVSERQSELPGYFVNAHDVTPEEHVRILATFQNMLIIVFQRRLTVLPVTPWRMSIISIVWRANWASKQ